MSIWFYYPIVCILNFILRAKLREVEAGADGFMVFDLRLLPAVQEMFNSCVPGDNQIGRVLPAGAEVRASDLLEMPSVS